LSVAFDLGFESVDQIQGQIRDQSQKRRTRASVLHSSISKAKNKKPGLIGAGLGFRAARTSGSRRSLGTALYRDWLS